MKKFFFNNDFTILLGLYFFLLPIGKTLWYPLFIMAIIGLRLLIHEVVDQRLSKGANWLLVGGSLIWFPAVFSLSNTIDIGRSLNFILSYPLFFLAGFFLYKRLSEGLNILPSIYVISCIVCFWGFFAIWQYLDPNNPFGPVEERFQGLHSKDNPYFDGGLMLGVILGSLFAFLVFSLWAKGFYFVSVFFAFFIIFLVYLSGTRSAWFSVLLSLFSIPLVAYLRGFKFSIRQYVFIFTFISSLLFVFSNFYESDSETRLSKTLSFFINPSWDALNYATSGRIAIWEDAIQLGLTSPIVGTGVNNFRFAQPQLPVIASFTSEWNADGYSLIGPTHAHQILLEAWSGAGALGLIGLLAYFVWLARTSIQVGKTGSLLAVSALVALWAGFFPLNTHNNFYGGWMSAWFWVWMGLSAGLIFRQEAKDP